MQSNKFCVYEHWRSDKGVCFYVGKGTIKRASSVIRRENPRHTRIVNKLSKIGMQVEVRIFRQGLSEVDAFALEISRIAHWREVGDNLVNLTSGGEGSSGSFHSANTKLKISKALVGRMSPLGGRTLSEMHKSNISKGLIGRKVSSETRLKLSVSQKGKIRPELIGRKLSDATLERMRNRIFTEKHREKISQGNIGKIRSAETKLKISEAVKRAILNKNKECV